MRQMEIFEKTDQNTDLRTRRPHCRTIQNAIGLCMAQKVPVVQETVRSWLTSFQFRLG
jgi:hypothetical protein